MGGAFAGVRTVVTRAVAVADRPAVPWGALPRKVLLAGYLLALLVAAAAIKELTVVIKVLRLR